ncbi:predicted protein [Nematostella vectensis]|uniref:G-protein coupled receptors family 1 profile domain-containing protein n=1 Tax=Nematostella vectensis TaxID=45351 RepID=A7RET9_NEMVE|nr:sphingosine 1-phosphate receptor 2 [Nematostella vectensis]XP_048580651.1 sphingosine 1-phosphate receptor 2 [Nematostella vectensis]EDO49975.1 predicted protein [Nematostella vectensis]|eukprot:XP_001642038.1 predicted protein [Nematostella vectensis]
MANVTLAVNTTGPAVVASTTPIPMLYNRNPDVDSWVTILLAVVYSFLCIIIVSPNYLTLRALYTTKGLMYRHKYLLGNLAFCDLLVGAFSVPAFAYNMMRWPSYAFLAYEAVDAFAGFSSVLTLTVISLRMFKAKVKPANDSFPSGRSECGLLVGIWFAASLITTFNVVSLLVLFKELKYIYYFYAVVGVLAVCGVIILVSLLTVMVLSCACACCKKKSADNTSDSAITTSIFIVTVISIIFWMLPYIYFTYNRVCDVCTPALPAIFFYSTRMLLYIKSFISPIIYIRRIMPFYNALVRILTRECFGAPSG